MTNSLCKAASSAFFTNTFFRNRKSSEAPGGATEDARSLLDTDAARDNGTERATGGSEGLPLLFGVAGTGPTVAVPLALLIPMMLVSSFLNTSRSATAWGLVN